MQLFVGSFLTVAVSCLVLVDGAGRWRCDTEQREEIDGIMKKLTDSPLVNSTGLTLEEEVVLEPDFTKFCKEARQVRSYAKKCLSGTPRYLMIASMKKVIKGKRIACKRFKTKKVESKSRHNCVETINGFICDGSNHRSEEVTRDNSQVEVNEYNYKDEYRGSGSDHNPTVHNPLRDWSVRDVFSSDVFI